MNTENEKPQSAEEMIDIATEYGEKAQTKSSLARLMEHYAQSRISELEAKNAKLTEALLNVRDRTMKSPVIYNIITKALNHEP